MSFVLGLIAAGCFGTADFMGGLSARRHHWLPVVALSQISALVVVLVEILIIPTRSVPFSDVLWAVAAGLGISVGISLLYRSLAAGLMSIVAPITALAGIGVPVLFGLATGEQLGFLAIGGIVIAVGAVILLGQTGEQDGGMAKLTVGTAIAALLAGVGIAVEYICLDQTTPGSGLMPLLVMRITCGLLLLVATGVVARRQLAAILTEKSDGTRTTPFGSSRTMALAAGAFDSMAMVLFLIAVRGDQLSLVATLVSLYPAGTVALAFVLLKERPNRIQRIGLYTAVIAVLALAQAPLSASVEPSVAPQTE